MNVLYINLLLSVVITFSTMSTTIEKIMEGFPYPTVIPITGLPNYEIVANLHEQLNAKASNLQSNLGDGAHGH